MHYFIYRKNHVINLNHVYSISQEKSTVFVTFPKDENQDSPIEFGFDTEDEATTFLDGIYAEIERKGQGRN